MRFSQVVLWHGPDLYPSLMREPELQEWVHISNQEEKKNFPLTDEMSLAIDRFFFNHYCQHFRSGAFARANCSMCVSHNFWLKNDANAALLSRPMLNMCGKPCTILLQREIADEVLHRR